MGSQNDFCHIDQPSVRKFEFCTDPVKTALVEVSVRTQILSEKACKEAQAALKTFYGHNYYLSDNEKYPEQAVNKTVEDYADYAEIFPDKNQLQNTSMARL